MEQENYFTNKDLSTEWESTVFSGLQRARYLYKKDMKS